MIEVTYKQAKKFGNAELVVSAAEVKLLVEENLKLAAMVEKFDGEVEKAATHEADEVDKAWQSDEESRYADDASQD